MSDLKSVHDRIAEMRARNRIANDKVNTIMRNYARVRAFRYDIAECLDVIDAAIAEREAWITHGDKGVAPYVEATDAALARFGKAQPAEEVKK